MRTTLRSLVSVALLGAASICHAGGELSLSWGDCRQGAGAVSNVESSCSSDAGEQSLYCAFTLDTAIDSVVALRVVLDLQHEGASLPDWWRFEPKGCRFGNLIASATFAGQSSCTDFWNGEASFDSPAPYFVGQPRGGAMQARILFSIGVPSSEFRRLDPGQMYYAARIRILNNGSGGCAGCSEAACLVLNSIEIATVSGETTTLETPGPGAANWATWQRPDGAECTAVPARSTTWGQMKSLYR